MPTDVGQDAAPIIIQTGETISIMPTEVGVVLPIWVCSQWKQYAQCLQRQAMNGKRIEKRIGETICTMPTNAG